MEYQRSPGSDGKRRLLCLGGIWVILKLFFQWFPKCASSNISTCKRSYLGLEVEPKKETVKRHCAVRRDQTKPNQSKLKGESCVPKTTVRYSKCVSDWLQFRMDGSEKTPPISKSVMHKVFWHKTIFCQQSCFSEVTEKALIEKHYYRIDVIQKVLAKKAMEEKER